MTKIRSTVPCALALISLALLSGGCNGDTSDASAGPTSDASPTDAHAEALVDARDAGADRDATLTDTKDETSWPTADASDAGNDAEASPDVLLPDGDIDEDGVENAKDNCPTTANPCQHDKDHDGIGNECDPTCEETCWGTTCNLPGAQGCNCGSCPSGYRCVYDTHYDDGICNDDEYYHVCAQRCDSQTPCSAGDCRELYGSGGQCICWSGGSGTMLPCSQ